MKTLTNELIKEYLFNKGFKAKYTGFLYWIKAINLAYNDRKFLRKINTNLLERLKIEFNMNTISIQSALRTVLVAAQPQQTVANFLSESILELEELCK